MIRRSTFFRAAAAAGSALLLSLPNAAFGYSSDVARVLGEWGILGTWSTDCAAPPGPDNTIYTYVERGGRVFLDRDGANFKDSSPITRAEVLPNGMIEYFVSFDTGRGQVVQINTYAKRADGRIRIFFNRRVDGASTVENGRLTQSGEETSWREKCPSGRGV